MSSGSWIGVDLLVFLAASFLWILRGERTGRRAGKADKALLVIACLAACPLAVVGWGVAITAMFGGK